MNLAFIQRLDQIGGGSRVSLRSTMWTLREHRPDWQLSLVTQSRGPLSEAALEQGISWVSSSLPRFRKPLSRFVFWRDCRRLASRLSGTSLNAIVSNEWVTAPHARAVAKCLKIPAISYVRDFIAVERGRKYLLHRMDRLLCVSESMRVAMIEAGYDPAKLKTVYNPVLKPVVQEPDPQLLQKIKCAGARRWLLYLGRISSRKNQIDAVETLKHLRKFSKQDWGLLIVGDEDEDYAKRLEDRIAASGLSGRALKLGMISQPGWLIDMVDASVLTSKSEGLARVLIESFLMRIPAFSYPMAGVEDVYGENLKDFVSQEGDPEALARIIAEHIDAEGTRRKTELLGDFLTYRHSVSNHVREFEKAVGTE
ncbi:MAG: glycosyltransferase family 4 protein [Luteolibacter sp.]